jgi:hypothetical protein
MQPMQRPAEQARQAPPQPQPQQQRGEGRGGRPGEPRNRP